MYSKCHKVNFKRGSSYIDYPDSINNWQGIDYPSKINDWKTFEINNPTIALNILHTY